MIRRIVLSPDARAEFDAAARWYRRQGINLSRRFIAEVRSTLLRIARHPYGFVQVDRAVRRASMNRFRYNIHFRLRADRVVVVAISHQRRADSVWKGRLDESPETHND